MHKDAGLFRGLDPLLVEVVTLRQGVPPDDRANGRNYENVDDQEPVEDYEAHSDVVSLDHRSDGNHKGGDQSDSHDHAGCVGDQRQQNEQQDETNRSSPLER